MSLTQQYLVRKRKAKAAHLWTGFDSMCRMASTGGLKMEKYDLRDDAGELPICHMCQVNAQKEGIKLD